MHTALNAALVSKLMQTCKGACVQVDQGVCFLLSGNEPAPRRGGMGKGNSVCFEYKFTYFFLSECKIIK